VDIVYFSPLRNEMLPENVDGILLGGGYPENYLEELSANKSMLKSIYDAIKSGMPVMAECGGFMYLLDRILDKDGRAYQMVGALKGEAKWIGKLVRFGYVKIDIKDGLTIKGHEFHYYDTDNNGKELLITKASTGTCYRANHKINGGYAGFSHLYYPSKPEVVSDFVEVMKNYGRS
jgi:cobyrinic acid a,c-diamide synthase